MPRLLPASLVLCCLALAACGGGREPNPPNPTPASTSQATGSATPVLSLPKIVAFGDSLTAGYGLRPEESYPALLQERLRRDGFAYEVVNAGSSGDTSAGGLRRIEWALEGGGVRFVVVELGANDLLRGQPVGEMRRNLSEIVRRAQARGARVLLAGMIAPSNAGREYQRESVEAYQSLAAEHRVPLIPFFLEGVAGEARLNLEDGIHPNPEGTKIVAETVYRALKPLLEEEAKR
ncbi:MAG: arylesterase [Acidobacteria bacterium]|nr:arylesterase [Acidobacteriota bacterium]